MWITPVLDIKQKPSIYISSQDPAIDWEAMGIKEPIKAANTSIHFNSPEIIKKEGQDITCFVMLPLSRAESDRINIHAIAEASLHADDEIRINVYTNIVNSLVFSSCIKSIQVGDDPDGRCDNKQAIIDSTPIHVKLEIGQAHYSKCSRLPDPT